MGDDFKIRFSTKKSSSLIFSLIIRAMNSETQRPSEDTECDSVKRAGSDFDLGKHNVSGELEAISGMDGKVSFTGPDKAQNLQARKGSRIKLPCESTSRPKENKIQTKNWKFGGGITGHSQDKKGYHTSLYVKKKAYEQNLSNLLLIP